VQFVFVVFFAGIRQVLDARASAFGHQLGKVAHAVGFGHLVDDSHPGARLGRVLDGELETLNGVLDVDEGSGLPARAVYAEGVLHCRLHEKAVEHCAIITIVIEAVDEPLIQLGLLGLCAPDDTLMQVGHLHAIILVVVGEKELILGFSQVVDTTGIRWIENFLLQKVAVISLDLNTEIAFRDLHAGRAVAVYPHGPKVHDVNILPTFNHGGEEIIGSVEIIIDGIAFVVARFHRVRC